MNFSGIIVGAAVFLIIGICHPIVIKMEFYWGKRSWWVLCLAGAVFAAVSLMVAAAFSCFWGIHELLAQEMRVIRGWFPENPARSEYYKHRREELGDIGPHPSHKRLKEKLK